MSDRLLIVCSANVCRSPLAVAVLDYAIVGRDVDHRIAMSSRGIDVEPGLGVCPLVLQYARHSHVWTRRINDHRAASLEAGELAVSDLVLTADRRVRSHVVKLDPRSAERTFTIREAAMLARLVAGDRRERPRDLAGFAAALNDNRGLTDLPALERPSVLPWHRLRLHAHDVPDAHVDPHVSHRMVYRTLAPAMEELAAHLTALASVRQG